MALELRQSVGAEHRLSQRLVLKLSHKLKLPSGWSFKEPEPMKAIEDYRGRRVIRITRDEIASFAGATLMSRELIKQMKPAVVLVSMRGVLPLFRCITQLGLLPHREGWKTMRLKMGDTTFQARKVHTSYFLDDLNGVVSKELKAMFRALAKKGQDPARIFFLDTSVTGTKLSWFMPQFLEIMGELADQVEFGVELINIILHHNQVGRLDGESGNGGALDWAIWNIGVQSLITEDSLPLLGVPYDREKQRCNPGAEGEVRAYRNIENPDILIEGPEGKLQLFERQSFETTAMLFARVVQDVIQKS